MPTALAATVRKKGGESRGHATAIDGDGGQARAAAHRGISRPHVATHAVAAVPAQLILQRARGATRERRPWVDDVLNAPTVSASGTRCCGNCGRHGGVPLCSTTEFTRHECCLLFSFLGGTGSRQRSHPHSQPPDVRGPMERRLRRVQEVPPRYMVISRGRCLRAISSSGESPGRCGIR